MNEGVKLQGNRVKAARKYRGFSQIELSDEVGISQSNLSFVESNRHSPSQELVDKLTKVLDVTEAWLKGDSPDGGIPLDSPMGIKDSEKEAISKRFVEAYNRLKTLNIIENDADFADSASIPRSSLSLALAGKTPIQFEWVPYLEERGANGYYIYNDQMPVIKLNRNKKSSDTEEVARNITILVQTIEEDMKLLKSYINQLI